MDLPLLQRRLESELQEAAVELLMIREGSKGLQMKQGNRSLEKAALLERSREEGTILDPLSFELDQATNLLGEKGRTSMVVF